jgi:hypothetical protein
MLGKDPGFLLNRKLSVPQNGLDIFENKKKILPLARIRTPDHPASSLFV